MKLLSDNKLIAYGTLAAAALTALSVAIGGTTYIEQLRDDVSNSMAVEKDHETRLRTVEATLSDIRGDVREMRADVRSIRASIDRSDKDRGAKDQETAQR